VFIRLHLFVCFVSTITKNYSTFFLQNSAGRYVARKNPLDFAGNPDHVMSGLMIRLALHVVPGRTVL